MTRRVPRAGSSRVSSSASSRCRSSRSSRVYSRRGRTAADATHRCNTPTPGPGIKHAHLWISVGMRWNPCGQNVQNFEQPRVVHMGADLVLEFVLENSPFLEADRPASTAVRPQIPQDLI